MNEPLNDNLGRGPGIGPIRHIGPIGRIKGGHSPRFSSALALAVMCLGAWCMAYTYLFAVGGSLKTRSEFTTARSAIIPPRFRPSKLIDRYAMGHSDAEYDAEMKRWPVWRNYVDAIVYGGID